MGRWSRHPMGSDGAFDAQNTLFEEIYDKYEDTMYDSDEDYAKYSEACAQFLRDMTLEQLKKLRTYRFLDEDTFVIPYSFLEFGVVPKDEILEELKDCLDYHDDFEYYGNGEEEEHVEFFKENFDKIIKGEMELPDDPGLLATIVENNSGIKI